MNEPRHESRSFLEDLEFEYRQNEAGLIGEVVLTPHTMVPGHDQVRVSVLASVADVITGIMVSIKTAPLIALTVDLAVRCVEPMQAGTYEMESHVVKLGRSLSVTEATFASRGKTVATSWATFMASPRPQDVLPELSTDRVQGTQRLDRPFNEALGIEMIEPGVAEVTRRPYTLQPAGTLQGGVVCALAEAAAETVIGEPLMELDVRYLSTIRIGPGRATARLVDDSHARVEVTDAGRTDGRVASVGFARSD